jgi:hypothetical protein
MHYEITICYIVLNQNFHPLSLFWNEHLDKQKKSTLFYGQP